MADTPTEQSGNAKPARQPYGPGLLMVLGLFFLVICAWCGYDLATKEEWAKQGRTYTILMNWGGLVGFAAAAVYTFVLAAVRWRKAASADSDHTTKTPPTP